MPGLRDILEAATHEDWRVRSEAYSRLFALAPELAALCLDMGEYVEATGRYLASMNDPSPAVAQSEALLARLNDLAPRREGERGVRWERP